MYTIYNQSLSYRSALKAYFFLTRSGCPAHPGQELDVPVAGPGGQVLEAAEELLLQHWRPHRPHIHVQPDRGISVAHAQKQMRIKSDRKRRSEHCVRAVKKITSTPNIF